MKIIPYEERFGEIKFPEGARELLEGKSIEEQLEYFRTSEFSSHSNTDYMTRTHRFGYKRLADDSGVCAIIEKDGIVVGAVIEGVYNREIPCLVEECICTYYDSENNGSGYKERADYKWLLCVPEGFGGAESKQ